MKNQLLINLHKKPHTVFTLRDIALWFPEIPYTNLKQQVSYLVTRGVLKNLRKGVYAKDEYNVCELANKLYVPSYISLETVLQPAGVTFQYYERIFAVSYLTRMVTIGNHTIQYRRIRKDILFNKQGIEEQGAVIIATPERAFLDAVFIYKNYHFDNLNTLDWNRIMELRDIYGSPVFSKRVAQYYHIHKEEDYA